MINSLVLTLYIQPFLVSHDIQSCSRLRLLHLLFPLMGTFICQLLLWVPTAYSSVITSNVSSSETTLSKPSPSPHLHAILFLFLLELGSIYNYVVYWSSVSQLKSELNRGGNLGCLIYCCVLST